MRALVLCVRGYSRWLDRPLLSTFARPTCRLNFIEKSIQFTKYLWLWPLSHWSISENSTFWFKFRRASLFLKNLKTTSSIDNLFFTFCDYNKNYAADSDLAYTRFLKKSIFKPFCLTRPCRQRGSWLFNSNRNPEKISARSRLWPINRITDWFWPARTI